MAKQDWNKLLTSNTVHFYIPNSLWCLVLQSSLFYYQVLLWPMLPSWTSKWIRHVEIHYIGCQQLVSVLFSHPQFHCFSFSEVLLILVCTLPLSNEILDNLTPVLLVTIFWKDIPWAHWMWLLPFVNVTLSYRWDVELSKMIFWMLMLLRTIFRKRHRCWRVIVSPSWAIPCICYPLNTLFAVMSQTFKIGGQCPLPQNWEGFAPLASFSDPLSYHSLDFCRITLKLLYVLSVRYVCMTYLPTHSY